MGCRRGRPETDRAGVASVVTSLRKRYNALNSGSRNGSASQPAFSSVQTSFGHFSAGNHDLQKNLSDGRTQTHLDPRKSIVKLRQAREEPALRECREGLDGQNVSPAAPRDTFRRIADLQECAGDAIVKLLPSSVGTTPRCSRLNRTPLQTSPSAGRNATASSSPPPAHFIRSTSQQPAPRRRRLANWRLYRGSPADTAPPDFLCDGILIEACRGGRLPLWLLAGTEKMRAPAPSATV